MSIIGFFFCFVQQKKNPTELGKYGIILNVIGFVLSIIFIIWLIPLIAQQIPGL